MLHYVAKGPLSSSARHPIRARRAAALQAAWHGWKVQVAAGPNPSKFHKTFQDFTVEHCWGVWVRPSLERKTRSMLNLGMLSVMGRWHEFEVHVRGALNNGVTEDEIIEIILQAGVYGGVPVAAEAMRIADRAVKTYKEP